MHVTVEQLDVYAASLPQDKVTRTFEAKLSLSGKTKLICKTGNARIFIKSVKQFQQNFPQAKLILNMLEVVNES